MPEPPIGAGPPRPVADLPPADVADGEAAAKRWLLGLMAARPLRDAPAVPTAQLARDAPVLCAAMLRAVGSDRALPALQPGGDHARLAARAGALAGAGSAASAVAAVGQLRTALWETLTEAMPALDAATTAALSTRLAHVCDLVAVATVSGWGIAEAPTFRLEDAREAATPAAAAAGTRDETAARDWRSAAQRLVGEGRGFALLTLEVDDAARLLAADRDGATAALARLEDGLRAELRPGDVLEHDGEGRFWLLVADLGPSGGRARAERLADAAAAQTLHGTPLSASIGVAAHPVDGHDLGDLAARADEALFAARAAGVPLA
jgi:GGDEF domain-containing protein